MALWIGDKMRKTIATESDWLEATYAPPLIRFLSERVTDRKEKLLSAACFRRIWHLLKTEQGRKAVEVLERYVDGEATPEQLAEAQEDAWQSNIEIPNPEGNNLPETQALAAIGLSASLIDLLIRVAEATAWEKVGTPEAVSEPEQRSQCVLVRDIFGNPFRPATFDAAWRTSTAVALARGMYESRDFSAMPILADALQDAGCDNDDILNHCRDPHATHVRGCWVVDLVLGKS
jgi:hypothetical protein